MTKKTTPQNNTLVTNNRYEQAWYAASLLVSAVFAFFAAQIIGPIFVSMLALGVGVRSKDLVWVFNHNVLVRFLLILTIEALTIWTVHLLLKRRKWQWKDIGLGRKPTWQDLGKGLITYGIYFLIYMVVIGIVSATHLVDTSQGQQLGFTNAQGIQLIFVFVALVLLPPIAEEILFRGFVYMGLRKRIKILPAALITSLLFGIAHLEFGSGAPLNWAAAIDTFTLSCVLVYITEKTQSLWPGMVVHMLKNSVAFIALFLVK